MFRGLNRYLAYRKLSKDASYNKTLGVDCDGIRVELRFRELRESFLIRGVLPMPMERKYEGCWCVNLVRLRNMETVFAGSIARVDSMLFADSRSYI